MPVALSQEFRLAAACCIWPPSSARQDAVRALAGEGLDWGHFVAVVARQRVAGMVQDGLTRAGVVPPDPQRQQIAETAAKIARDNLRCAAESLRLQTELEALGLEPIFFKGVSLAQRVFGGLSLRHSKDIDFLVAPAQVPVAMTALEQAGYRRVHPPPGLSEAEVQYCLAAKKECEFLHPATGVQVEVHSRLTDNPFLLSEKAARQHQTIRLAGNHGLRTLGDDALFAYLCAHGAATSWMRLKWLADIGALLAQTDETGIWNFYQSARALGVARGAGQALLLSETLLAAKLPARMSMELRSSARLRWLQAVAIDAMAGGGAREIYDRKFGTTRNAIAQFLLGQGWRYSFDQLIAQAVSLDDLALLRLPRPLFFLYPILRLPLWLWRRVTRGGRSAV